MSADAAECVRLRQENEQLRRELAEAREQVITVRPEFRLPPTPRPKPRVSLEEARAMAALAVEMGRAPDRPEDPDA